MTYPDDLDPDYQDDSPDPQQESHDIRRLREKAKQADKISAENTSLKRQLAFASTGIDQNTPLGELFTKAYDGAPTPEAVREAAVRYGVIAPPEPVVSPEEAADLRVAASVTQSNASTTGVASNTISADDAAGWPMDTAMRFARTHPTEWEALKRGEDVLRP